METISIIYSIYNRTNLLKLSFEAIQKQIKNKYKIELNILDENSTDGLLEFAKEIEAENVSVNVYSSVPIRERYNIRFNCPAAFYNTLVHYSTGETIIKLDPEFVIISETFFAEAMELLRQQGDSFIMPLPHHVKPFEYETVDDVRASYAQYEYQTHIRPSTAGGCNVYYGCIFNRRAYIELGGIDVRFSDGIGSEDDHFLDQWRRKYGNDKVVSLIHLHGVHLHHGGFSDGVPPALNYFIELNGRLRNSLKTTFPNDGNFYQNNLETTRLQ